MEGAHTGKSLDEKIVEALDRKVTEVLEESKKNEQRKLNIIVSNLPESMVGTVEERRREDSEKVKHLVTKITNIEGGDLRDPIRLGPILHHTMRHLQYEVSRLSTAYADVNT